MPKIESTINNAFAKGLKAGFAGESTFEKVVRGKFGMKSSSFTAEGLSYIDQWFAGRVGGGQEILEVGGERYTRVYAGGTAEESVLASLHITKDDILGCLKGTILAAGEKIRFDQPYIHENTSWKYEYTPGDTDKVTGMISGKEKISYKGTPVFVHLFIISRVE